MRDDRVGGTFEEYQMAAYDRLVQAIADFDAINGRNMSLCIINSLMNVLSAFSRAWIFLDEETSAVFNERISTAWKEGEFDYLLTRERYEDIYDELRHRLTGEVLPAARNSLKKRFPEAY